jgi:hypothetical protein
MMNKTIIKRRSISIASGMLLCIAVLFAACNKSTPAASATEPAPVSPPAAPTVEAPAQPVQLQGMVSFLCGTVTMTVNGADVPLDIGVDVPVDASITTGKDAVCEIQFADFGSVHISQDSTLVVKRFLSDATHTESEMQLNAGKVVCKVRKLSGDDSFQIRTAEMVCGVRGTVFQVSKDEKKPVKIAVSEGSVAVYPPSVDDAQKLPDAISKQIADAAPLVTAGQEASLNAESIKGLDQSLKEIISEKNETTDQYKIIAASVLKDTKPVTAVTKADFTDAANLKLGAPAPVPEISSPDSSAAEDTSDKAVARSIQVSVTVEPANAVTTVNKAAKYKGSFSGIFAEGESLELNVTLDGYKPFTETLSVEGDSDILKEISLEKIGSPAVVETKKIEPPKDTSFIIPVSASKLINVTVKPDGSFFATDSKSGVTACSSDGKTVWTAGTDNGTNVINPTVFHGGEAVFAGDKNLAVFDAASGTKLWSIALDKTNTGLYGRHPAIALNRLYLAGDTGIDVYNIKNGSKISTIALSDGTDMTPSVIDGKIIVVSKTGTWSILNPETGTVESSLSTGAVQPVASSVVVKNGVGFFADRKGTIFAINIAGNAIVWQSKLDSSKNIEVFTDPVITASGVYVYSKNVLYGLSATTGKKLFEPIANVTSQACAVGKNLWCGGTGNVVMIISPKDGSTVKKIPVPAAVSGTPVFATSRVLVPLSNGQVYSIDVAAQ